MKLDESIKFFLNDPNYMIKTNESTKFQNEKHFQVMFRHIMERQRQNEIESNCFLNDKTSTQFSTNQIQFVTIFHVCIIKYFPRGS